MHTAHFFARRILLIIPVFVIVTLATEALIDLIPGSPARLILGNSASAAAVAQVNAQYGFNRPYFSRYWSWITGLFHGNLGRSVQTQQPVVQIILQHAPVTLELAVLAVACALILSVAIASFIGPRTGGVSDRIATGVSSALISIPSFVGSLLLIYLLAIKVRLFPPVGWVSITSSLSGNLSHAALPVAVLTAGELPVFLRVLRSELISTLQENYILAARAKGLPNWYIVLRHALRPSSLSLTTLAGLSFGRLLGGAIIVETVFALPGVGYLAQQSIFNKDIPIVQGLVVLIALVYLLLNMLVDYGYTILDPRIERG
jgi:peptide/nickel transport system permease protein